MDRPGAAAGVVGKSGGVAAADQAGGQRVCAGAAPRPAGAAPGGQALQRDGGSRHHPADRRDLNVPRGRSRGGVPR